MPMDAEEAVLVHSWSTAVRARRDPLRWWCGGTRSSRHQHARPTIHRRSCLYTIVRCRCWDSSCA